MDRKIVEKSDSESTETEDSETESEDSFNTTAQSPLSGSVNYFVAPLESSETQAMVIEELNQVSLLINAVFTGSILVFTLTLCMRGNSNQSYWLDYVTGVYCYEDF